ncbi:hypothetical protein DPMN_068432 [Dreissena polymorpha]|uniref:Uncharacterized protein n=1 Tax=Dreissena polymorpha TaxID=45954 RepID=A0A9D3Z288_DREPO|nr:hypothetical protein DPMN_068432 [Dreissena polymorpha]
MIENFLTLKEELDLDAGLQSQLETTNITVKITCYKSSHTLHVFIEPVNEFPPFFLDRPYYTTIPENTQVGASVFEMKSKMGDFDIPADIIKTSDWISIRYRSTMGGAIFRSTARQA